jgi:hypothetical protein
MKLATSYQAANHSLSLNGSAVITAVNAQGLPPGITTLRIGSQIGSNQIGGWMRGVRYWPRALTNAEMIAETSAAQVRAMVLA